MTQEGNRRPVRLWLTVVLAVILTCGVATVLLLRQPGRVPDHSALQSSTPNGGGGRFAAAGRPTLWVLAVGISKYSDPRLTLRFAAADASAVAAALARQRGGPFYADVQTEVLVDADATRANILRALDDFMGRAAPVDVGVIYMAGHGARDDILDNYYFLPVTAQGDRPRIEGLDMNDFNRQLRALHRNLRRLVVILDTCHAGAVAGGTSHARVGEDLAARLPPAEGLYILAAAKSGEQARENASVGHGVFTKALLDGLQGAAADADGVIRVLGLASFVSRVVPQRTGKAQTPYLSIVGGDLALLAHPQRFKQVTPPPVPSPVAILASAKQRERVAVMSFDNLRPDPQHDWMRQALVEQFAAALHQIPQFDIYDERMVRFLARGATDPIEASQRADMTKLVDGTYWVNDNRISIAAHVKNTNPLKSVASAIVDGPLDQFSALTNQIVVSLLEQLHIELLPAEIEQLRQRQTTDLAARKLLFDAERSGGEASGPEPTPAPKAGPEASRGAWIRGFLRLAAMSYAAGDRDPEAELRATLEGYRRAFEREDIDELARYYVEFTDEQRTALQGYFRNAGHLRVEFDDIRIAIIGDQAAISFSREDHFVDRRSGDRQQVVVRVTKLFAKGAAGWQIVPEP